MSWRNHPVTLMVRRYFTDFADQKIEEGKDAMLALTLEREEMIGIAGAVAIYTDLADIQFADVLRFYEQTERNEEMRRKAKEAATPPELADLPSVVDEEEEEDDAQNNDGKA